MGQLSERIQDYRERLRDWWADGGLGRGLLAVALVVYLLIALVVGFFWSTEPEPFAVKERADQRAAAMGLENVIGFTTTSTLMNLSTITTVAKDCGGHTWDGCSKQCRRWQRCQH